MSISFGLCPFWFWNGAMENGEIERQIRLMHESRIGGFMIQARQGLTIPYLSRLWFDKVGVAVEAAKHYGMDVWLCDEYPYPSGNAGGQVLLEHPEYAAFQLQVVQRDLHGPQELILELPWCEPVLAAAYPVRHDRVDWEAAVDLRPEIGIISPDRIFQRTGLTSYNRKRFFSGRPRKQLRWTAPGGEWRVYLFVQVAMEHQKFFGKFIDPLNKRAVECFIRVTHEKYREYLGHEFGGTIKGFFVDEIEPQPHGGELRWSPVLPELFWKKKGYQLIPNLPALLEPFGKDTAKIRYDYWDVLTQAFIETFDKPVAEWCHANKLLYGGEKPILRSSQLQYLDVPGIDGGHQKVGSEPVIASVKYRANAKLLGSAAHFYGKSRALCECFHSVGWGMTLQDMRWMIDWLAVQGVNLFVPHAFFYTTNALAKHDAPPSSFDQNPAWTHLDMLARHVETLSELGGDYQRQVDILVVDPITSQWTARGEKRHVGKKLAEDFSRLQQALLRNHLDFHIIDPQQLAKCRVREGQLVLGAERFSIIVLPPMLNLERVAFDKIKEFIAADGCVIGTGCLPVEEIDGNAAVGADFSKWFGIDAWALYNSYCSDRRDEMRIAADGRRRLVRDHQELVSVLDGLRIRKISVSAAGRENEAILANYYVKGDIINILVLNTSGIRQMAEVGWNGSRQNYHVCERSTTAARQRQPIKSASQDGGAAIQVELAPYQSRLYELSPSQIAGSVGDSAKNHGVVYCLNATEQWELKAPWNAFRLDDWQLGIEQIDSKPAENGLCFKKVRSSPIINQVSESGVCLPVFLANYFGCPYEMVLPGLTCTYHTEWQVEAVPSDAWLVMEEGALSGAWQITLNGLAIPAAAFVTKAFYAADNRAAAITNFLTPGRNILEVKVQTGKPDDGLVNPLYICGDFGVFPGPGAGEWRLGPLPAQGAPWDRVRAGLPFYAGTLEYSCRMNFSKSQPVELELTNFEDAVELSLNGHSVGARAWEPFVWELPAEWIKEGENLIAIRLQTTLLGLYEGSYFDREAHCYREY